MELTGLIALFDVFDGEREALESFQEIPSTAAAGGAVTGKLDAAIVS